MGKHCGSVSHALVTMADGILLVYFAACQKQAEVTILWLSAAVCAASQVVRLTCFLRPAYILSARCSRCCAIFASERQPVMTLELPCNDVSKRPLNLDDFTTPADTVHVWIVAETRLTLSTVAAHLGVLTTTLW